MRTAYVREFARTQCSSELFPIKEFRSNTNCSSELLRKDIRSNPNIRANCFPRKIVRTLCSSGASCRGNSLERNVRANYFASRLRSNAKCSERTASQGIRSKSNVLSELLHEKIRPNTMLQRTASTRFARTPFSSQLFPREFARTLTFERTASQRIRRTQYSSELFPKEFSRTQRSSEVYPQGIRSSAMLERTTSQRPSLEPQVHGELIP